MRKSLVIDMAKLISDYCSFTDVPREGWTTVKIYVTKCNQLLAVDSDIKKFNYCPFCGKEIMKR